MVEYLQSPSVIAYPDFSIPFTIHVDADYFSRHPVDDFEIMNKEADKMMSSEDINLVFAAASQENEELIKNVKIETLDLKR